MTTIKKRRTTKSHSTKKQEKPYVLAEDTEALDINPLFQSDEELAILDNALSAAEEILRPLLAKSSASEVTAAFKQHVAGHLGVEMSNLEEHGHVNDDPNDEPSQPTVYRALVELAQLVQAGNTEFDGLERSANEVLARVNALTQ